MEDFVPFNRFSYIGLAFFTLEVLPSPFRSWIETGEFSILVKTFMSPSTLGFSEIIFTSIMLSDWVFILQGLNIL